MKLSFRSGLAATAALAAALTAFGPARVGAQSAPGYLVYVSNEKSGDLSVIDPVAGRAVAKIPVGKRPRGLRASPDGATLFVAVSGTPIAPPPKLDANGNPIFERGKTDDDDDDAKSDKAADGIAVVDLAQRKFLRKISVGSDPEQMSVSADGQRLYVSNEDVGTASILNIASGKVERIIPVHKEPEGVTTSPDGKTFVVTCESDGEIFVIDAAAGKALAHFNVGGRPRTVDFLPDGTRAFIPSESAGQVHVIDTAKYAVLKSVQLAKGCRPMCVKVAPDGKKVYVSTGRAGSYWKTRFHIGLEVR